MAPVALFILAVLAQLVVLHSAQYSEAEPSKRCPGHFCSETVGHISFPFKSPGDPPECGLFKVNCSVPDQPKIQLKERGYWYEFQGPLFSPWISIKDRDLADPLEKNRCDDRVLDALSLPNISSIPEVSLSTPNLTLLKCNNILDKNSCPQAKYVCGNAYHTYYINSSNSNLPNPPPPGCTTVQVPRNTLKPNTYPPWTAEFYLAVATPECFQCLDRKGECLVEEGKFKCTKDQVAGHKQLQLKLGLGAVAGLIFLVVIVCCLRRKLSSYRFLFFWKKQNQNHQIVEAFLRSYGPLQVRRYSYVEVKNMTNSFKEKLGSGGYGAVYKGKLKDGCLVAVKVLTKLTGDGEEFMNEVAAISRTSHVNVVTLLGFCFEGSKRALIYEFMPNGSLEKFIFDSNTPNIGHDHLGWEALDQISLGIARGLEYLHRGCNTRILHFDIKPHNILLDENFTPKISDFGLAKICNRRESIVSMLGARGTAGYIAPEVFSRNFGKVSHKSDVYSYGMMLLDMVGGRRNINAEAENTSEIYFPHWIYKRLELDEELGLQSVANEEDKARARKMIIVSLWCVQTDPSNRPAMNEVIDMLEGNVDLLQIPPKPYMSSPPKSLADSSAALVSIK
ncbi:LEAF RUST 10 DISEASE-RESISTANCE LOCUS RECEPTOR-LIKE PROTEIN KINASE-like 2.1 [Pyrus x bretschneideri]|uniref:LEAF RUST 10 DISEASE-RESISTANCE LOCUS RECEPTOR-LIKE PROTEIN KINASE-like 2.1 n=1 Tax=Pyrus x bretschneideri TaxID=225117 RepID=UPI0020300E62|nr:LEAF RUST 10 DISEASE-RESISTANCE LOCUS RECEPTOR-LIKE PROTEIN KINASE-like 2.1 [Pyrus x bretschneideri]